MLATTRLVIGAAAALGVGIGLLLLVVAPAEAKLAGLWLIVLGVVGLVGVAFERLRYRSEAAEEGGRTGPDGVDDERPEPRFRPTDERFVDPTTRQQVRVWVDPATGERRYRRDE